VSRSALRISPVGPAEWRATVETASDAPPAADPLVAGALARGRRGRAEAVLLESASGAALLPMVVHRRKIGDIVEAMPHGLASGPVPIAGDPPCVEAGRLRRALRAQRMSVAVHHLQAPRHPGGPGTTHVVELAAGRPRPHERARRKLRAAARAGVEVRQGSAGDVPTLLAILRAAADVRGGTQYSDDIVTAVATCDRALVLLASRRDRDVSAALFLDSPLEVFYWLGGTLPDAVDASPSYAVIDAAIAFAAKRERRFANLGSSDGLGGVAFFKEGFGARRVPNPVFAVDSQRYRAVSALRRRFTGLP
jgi:hypothetical protein